MIHLTSFKFLSAIAILGMTLAAGWMPFRKKAQDLRAFHFATGEALACGVFLGAGLIHMLGDAATDFAAQGYHYPFAFLLAGCMFIFLLWLEHIGRELDGHGQSSSPRFALLALLMLSIHSLLEGAALGLATTLATGGVFLLAILAHKWAASFALSIQMNKTTLKLSQGIPLFGLFALMSPLGILLGSWVASLVHTNSLLVPIFTSLAAGTFLYIGTLHGLKRSVLIEQCCNLREFSFMIFGFSLMALVAIWT